MTKSLSPGGGPNVPPDGAFLEACIRLRDARDKLTIEDRELVLATVAYLKNGRALSRQLKEGISELCGRIFGEFPEKGDS